MSYDSSIPFQCMNDCIHLKACRRIQKIGKSKHLIIPRYCSDECDAYETIEAYEDGTVRIIQGKNYDYDSKSYKPQRKPRKPWELCEEKREHEEILRKTSRALSKELHIGIVLAEYLCKDGYDTIPKIKEATDMELLKIRGIGQVRLKKIRNVCVIAK